MGLNLKHFDTRTGNWITFPNPDFQSRQETPRLVLEESLENTLLEAFIKKEFPNSDYSNRFSIGHIDEVSTAEELAADHHPNGDVLLLSSGSRLLYGPAEIREQLIAKLTPDKMHNGAYGSILTGECANTYQGQATYLVIDDSNGENGGYMNNQQAWRLVGDCHGKISPDFSQQLSGTARHVLQFRFGNLDDGLYAKGTLAAKDIAGYFHERQVGQQVAFVIPTSSFKGAGKGSVKPGLYSQEIWLGEKDRSQRGEIALSQLLASYPEALRDFIPELEDHLEKLNQIVQDPRQLAEHYCERYEARQQKIDPNWQPPAPEETAIRYRAYLEQQPQKEGEEPENESQYEEFLYLALKADPYYQRLLGTKKFTQALTDFVRRDYLEAAVGKLFKFDRGLIIPSKDLKTGEICVPWLEDGEKVLEFRSPFLNHNATIYSTNKHVEDMYAPDGGVLQGAIAVNDEDYARILQRLSAEAREAALTRGIELELPELPDNLNNLSVDERIALSDRLNESLKKLNEAGSNIELASYESDSERQGRDFDGDCLGVAEAGRYPYLAKEVVEKTQLENLFRPTRKEAKVSFPEGTPFEVMAIHTADGISVGSINNAVTSFEALLSELELVEKYGTPAEQQELAGKLAATAQQALSREAEGKQYIPDALRPHFQAITKGALEAIAKGAPTASASQVLAEPGAIPLIFAEQRQIYRWLVEEGCYQNQVAVDLFKSARQPDRDAIASLTKLLYRDVDYFKRKKDYGTYRTKPLEVRGTSPVELTAALVNAQFQESQLTAKPPEQYRDLFPADYSQQQLLAVKAVKAQYDSAYNLAAAYNRKRRTEDGPVLQVTTGAGKVIEVTNYKLFNSHSEVQLLAEKPLSLRLVQNQKRKTENTHQLLAQYQELKAGQVSTNCTLEVVQSLSKQQVQILFQQADQIARDWRQTLDEGELFQYGCAAWHLCHNHGQEATNNFAYAAFGDLILDQISQPQLQFSDFVVGKLREYDEVPQSLKQSGESLDLELREESGKRLWYVQNPQTGEYHRFGAASEKAFQLPAGTKVRGAIAGDLFTTAKLDISNLEGEIVIGNMNKYPMVGHEFRGESHLMVLSSQMNAPPQPIVRLNGQKLGQLDRAAVELFQQHGVYRDISFAATLTSYGEGRAREIIATTPQGTSFRIEKSHFLAEGELKEREFPGETVSLSLKLESPKQAMVAHIWQPDASLLPIGEFTSNQKASKEALRQAGLFREGAAFVAAVTSRITAARIAIAPDSVRYPALRGMGEQGRQGEKLTHTPHTPHTPHRQLAGTAGHLIDTLSHQPTLLHQFQQEWQLPDGKEETMPTLGLSVDLARVAATKEYLEGRGIPYALLAPNDPRTSLETERGYGVFWLVEADVPPAVRSQMELAAKGIHAADLADIATISPYVQQLESIPCLPPERLKERLEKSQPAFAKVTVGLPHREPHQAGDGREPLRGGEASRLETSPASPCSLSPPASSASKPDNPFLLVPQSENPQVERNRVKDRAMAAIATQFIGVPAQEEPTKLSSTRDYQQAWFRYGLANTGSYTADDIIMVSGSGPWRGVSAAQIQATFERHYQPLLERASAAGASFVMGNAKGTDKLVQAYLARHGYQLSETGQGYLQANPQLAQSLSPQQLQAQRTQAIAPTVKAYLDLAETHHHQSQKYTATWDSGSRTLSLVGDNQLKMLARHDGSQWQSLPVPLAEPAQPNLTDEDVSHFQALAPRIQAELEERRQDYRAWYESLREQVMVGNGHHSPEEIDRAIAVSVLEETGDVKDVARVLSQCDRVREWRGELSEPEFRERAREYVRAVYDSLVQEVRGREVKEVEDLVI